MINLEIFISRKFSRKLARSLESSKVYLMSDSGPGDTPQRNEQGNLMIPVPLVTLALVLESLNWDSPSQRDAGNELSECVPTALRRYWERKMEPYVRDESYIPDNVHVLEVKDTPGSVADI